MFSVPGSVYQLSTPFVCVGESKFLLYNDFATQVTSYQFT